MAPVTEIAYAGTALASVVEIVRGRDPTVAGGDTNCHFFEIQMVPSHPLPW